MENDDIQRVLNYLDSQHVGFIADVDVEGLLMELCIAELAREPEEVPGPGHTTLELDPAEGAWLRRQLQGEISTESPNDLENRLRVLSELPVDDDDIPF